ncbi:hypothetical protein ABI59_12155 [Acidobacteria bacterium Mor1]|nr:hypothetical protein ABI59_12155 [Acidobacteria bacterium Mor1]
MSGFSVRDVARMVELPVGRVRSLVRDGILAPQESDEGEARFDFQDVALLRTAKGLLEKKIPARRVQAALRQLRAQLPGDLPLTSVQIGAAGKRVFVHRGGRTWEPETGQTLLNFEGEKLTRVASYETHRANREATRELTAEEWYEIGVELEPNDPERARQAYLEALFIDPDMAEAHTDLGRSLHEAGEPEEALEHYRSAADLRPEDHIAAFNLGVCYQDLNCVDEAIEAYKLAIRANARFPDAHFNLGRLYEKRGERLLALRHLATYRRLTSQQEDG